MQRPWTSTTYPTNNAKREVQVRRVANQHIVTRHLMTTAFDRCGRADTTGHLQIEVGGKLNMVAEVEGILTAGS